VSGVTCSITDPLGCESFLQPSSELARCLTQRGTTPAVVARRQCGAARRVESRHLARYMPCRERKPKWREASIRRRVESNRSRVRAGREPAGRNARQPSATPRDATPGAAGRSFTPLAMFVLLWGLTRETHRYQRTLELRRSSFEIVLKN